MQTDRITVSRTARFFTLGDIGASTRELWVVLHGYGQSAEEFLSSFRNLDNGTRVIVAPEGLSRFYLRGSSADSRVGASWMTREDREQEITDYIAYLDALVAKLLAELPPATPITLLGFSQGGATAARWGLLGGYMPSRIILWGSQIPPDLPVDKVRERLRKLELVVVHALRDAYIDNETAERHRRLLTQQGIEHIRVDFDGEHTIEPNTLLSVAIGDYPHPEP